MTSKPTLLDLLTGSQKPAGAQTWRRDLGQDSSASSPRAGRRAGPARRPSPREQRARGGRERERGTEGATTAAENYKLAFVPVPKGERGATQAATLAASTLALPVAHVRVCGVFFGAEIPLALLGGTPAAGVQQASPLCLGRPSIGCGVRRAERVWSSTRAQEQDVGGLARERGWASV